MMVYSSVLVSRLSKVERSIAQTSPWMWKYLHATFQSQRTFAFAQR